MSFDYNNTPAPASPSAPLTHDGSGYGGGSAAPTVPAARSVYFRTVTAQELAAMPTGPFAAFATALYDRGFPQHARTYTFDILRDISPFKRDSWALRAVFLPSTSYLSGVTETELSARTFAATLSTASASRTGVFPVQMDTPTNPNGNYRAYIGQARATGMFNDGPLLPVIENLTGEFYRQVAAAESSNLYSGSAATGETGTYTSSCIFPDGTQITEDQFRDSWYLSIKPSDEDQQPVPALWVQINSRSGGRHGHNPDIRQTVPADKIFSFDNAAFYLGPNWKTRCYTNQQALDVYLRYNAQTTSMLSRATGGGGGFGYTQGGAGAMWSPSPPTAAPSRSAVAGGHYPPAPTIMVTSSVAGNGGAAAYHPAVSAPRTPIVYTAPVAAAPAHMQFGTMNAAMMQQFRASLQPQQGGQLPAAGVDGGGGWDVANGRDGPVLRSAFN